METEKRSYELNYLSRSDVDEAEAQETEAGIRKIIEDGLEKYLYEATERRPLVLPVVVEV